VASRPAADFTWETAQASSPNLAKNDTLQVSFIGTPRAGLDDPAGISLGLAVAMAAGTDSLQAIAGIGARAGFQACLAPEASRTTHDCSDPQAPWSVPPSRCSGRLEP
jgi:hypothetical protein